MNKNKIVKIVAPIFIVLIIVGIWFFKNTGSGSTEKNLQPEHEDFALEATSVDLESLTSHGIPVIIDFGSDSCIPCQEMAPVLKTLNKEMQGVAIIKFIDVWKYSDAASGFPLQLIPTQIFIEADGKPYVPSDNIDIEFIKYSYRDSGEHAYTVHQGALTEEQMRKILADMGAVK